MDATASPVGAAKPTVTDLNLSQQNAPPANNDQTKKPDTPISIGHPEVGAISQKTEQPVQTVEHTPVLELKKEILPGVEEVHHESEHITLPTQIQQAGVDSSMPIPIGAITYKAPAMVLPLSQTQLKKGLHKPVKSSVRWLAEWCVKQLKEAHLGAKRKKKKGM